MLPSPQVLRDLLKQNNKCLSMIESHKTLYVKIVTERQETPELESERKDQLGEWANATLWEVVWWQEELKWVQEGVDWALQLHRRAQCSEKHAEPSPDKSSIPELQAIPACMPEDSKSSPSEDVGSEGTQTLMEEGATLEPSQDEHIQHLPSMVAKLCSSYNEVLLVPVTISKSSNELCSMSPELSCRAPGRLHDEALPAASLDKRPQTSEYYQGRGNHLLSLQRWWAFDKFACRFIHMGI